MSYPALFDPKTSLGTWVGLFDPVNEQACCLPGGSPSSYQDTADTLHMAALSSRDTAP